jgi:hypothetical protein
MVTALPVPRIQGQIHDLKKTFFHLCDNTSPILNCDDFQHIQYIGLRANKVIQLGSSGTPKFGYVKETVSRDFRPPFFS